jgi:hypothetical protein
MQKLYISPTINSPEIILSPEENIFSISGISSPEDVRRIYYPVFEWIKEFMDEVISGKSGNTIYNEDSPFRLRIDLMYFNSSSAKFLFDIFVELKRFGPARIPFDIEWVYDKEDTDLREAGEDIASIAEMDFSFIAK